MDGDANAQLPSLLLAELHKGQHDHHNRDNHLPLLHQHALLHKRQTDGTASVVEVVQTVSVVQQIEVDSDGNTVSTIVTPVATPDSAFATTTPADSAAAASTTASDGLASLTSQSSSDLSSSSTAVLTSTPSASIPTSSSFASFFVSSNSTSLIASSTTSSLSQSRFFNSSSTLSTSSSFSSSIPSFTFLTSSSSSTRHSTTHSASSTSTSFSHISSPSPTSTGVDGVLAGGGAATTTDPQASSTSSSGSDSSNNDSSSTATTPVIIGSVVSSLAGAAFIVLVILFLWRWKKRSRTLLPLGSGNSIREGPGDDSRAIEAPPGPPPQPSSTDMVERRSFAYAFPAALANLTGYKRFSQRTETGTISSTAGSERGFYRVSGRKLPSVFQNGGDGYGGGIDETIAGRDALSGASFYSDNQGFYGGLGNSKSTRDSGVPVMRPSPARTPVTEQGPFAAPLDIPTRDLVGRSHPSRDGSHASKFTEEV